MKNKTKQSPTIVIIMTFSSETERVIYVKHVCMLERIVDERQCDHIMHKWGYKTIVITGLDSTGSRRPITPPA